MTLLSFLQLEDWTAHSLLTNRIFTIGRFTVTTKAKGKDTAQLDSCSDSDDGLNPPKLIQPVKAPQKRKPILRKPSFRRVDHGEEIPDEAHRKHALYPETATRLEDLARRGMTGSTTILPGMKLKRSNSDTLTTSNSRASLAQEFFRAQGMDGSGRDSRESKKVWFSKETQGLSDSQDDSDRGDGVLVSPLSLSAPSDYSRSEWMLDENAPLIVSDSRSGSRRSSGPATSSLDSSDVDPSGLPEEIYEGLKNSLGADSINGKKKKGDVPPSLANLFGSQPDRTLDQTDGPSPFQTNQPQPDSMPSSLKGLFGPPTNHDKNVPSSPPENPSRPRVLPISPLAHTDSPPTFRRQFPCLPVSRMSRSAPTSPDHERRWNAFREISDPLTPSPEDASSIPLESVTRRSADFPLGKKSAALRVSVDTAVQTPTEDNSAQVAPVSLSPLESKESGGTSTGNSRFAVKSAKTPEAQSSKKHSTSPSQRKKASGNSRFAVETPTQAPGVDNSAAYDNDATESVEPSRPLDMPRSRVSPCIL